MLGETIEEIAAEKAAIIRPRTGAAVLAPQAYEAAADVVRARAEGAGVPLTDVGASYSWRVIAHDLRGQDVSIEWPDGALDVRLPLLGAHQAENAATAVAAAVALKESAKITDEAIVRGLAEELAPLATLVFAARSAHPRSLEPSEIAALFAERGVRAEHVDSVAIALESAMATNGSDAVICLTGSLFVAAEGRAHLGRAAV